jgi:hypothetical protein
MFRWTAPCGRSAPLFAAAFATHNPWETFLVGMAASVGAGISMGCRNPSTTAR